jgi:DNA modification methylase
MKEIIGNCTLYCGDSYELSGEILSSLNNFIDCVLTDPPYGLGDKFANFPEGCFRKDKKTSLKFLQWDAKAADIDFILKSELPAIVFGGNYFNVPPSRCWLIWDKGGSMRGRSFADGEMAWTNLDKNMRIYEYNPIRSIKEFHPTQKPVDLMKWCLSHFGNPTHVFDPFMGSGSTGVACVEMGLSFTGIEKDQEYFDISCKRIEDAYRQGDLFL